MVTKLATPTIKRHDRGVHDGHQLTGPFLDSRYVCDLFSDGLVVHVLKMHFM